MVFRRAIVAELAKALEREPPLLHIIVGPRQVGKTTAAEQLTDLLGWPTVFAAADSPLPLGPEWIETQWRLARMQEVGEAGKVLLVLDEVQKVPGWSESVKRLWDEERRKKGPVRGPKLRAVGKTLGEVSFVKPHR